MKYEKIPERLKHVFKFYGLKPKQKQPDNDPGFVYLIQCNVFVKIGKADNVSKRMKDLQPSNPYKLRLLKAFPSQNTSADEAKVHKCLRCYHERGEWYMLPQSIIDLLIYWKDLSKIDRL